MEKVNNLLFLYLDNKLDLKQQKELENNYIFMLEVINYTNDKSYYFKASDNVKKKFQFVKLLVYRFSEDQDFIIYIADHFLNNTNSLLDTFELNIILNSLFKDIDTFDSQCYSLKAEDYYFQIQFKLEIFLEEEDLYIENISKFSYFKELFIKRPIILNYIAKKMLEEFIFYNKDYTFHEIVSKIMDSQYRFTNNLFNFINKYDYSLSCYLTSNRDILEELEKEIYSLDSNLFLKKENNIIKFNFLTKKID